MKGRHGAGGAGGAGGVGSVPLVRSGPKRARPAADVVRSALGVLDGKLRTLKRALDEEPDE